MAVEPCSQRLLLPQRPERQSALLLLQMAPMCILSGTSATQVLSVAAVFESERVLGGAPPKSQ